LPSSYDRKNRVDGSCLTDATCDSMASLATMYVHSTVHMALLARYVAQCELVYRFNTEDTRSGGRPVDVLDVGCNNGAALRLYGSSNFQTQRRRRIRYLGLDLDEAALKNAAHNVPSTSYIQSAVFECTDITQPWPVDDESFDVIWYTEAVEHVPAEAAPHTLREAFRAARPGARMLLSTPAPFDPDVLVWPESHDHEFSREEMRAMIDAAGWRRVDEYGLNTNWTRGRRRLRWSRPEVFELYEVLRRRIGGSLARVAAAALAPEVCDDLVHVCVKDV